LGGEAKRGAAAKQAAAAVEFFIRKKYGLDLSGILEPEQVPHRAVAGLQPLDDFRPTQRMGFGKQRSIAFRELSHCRPSGSGLLLKGAEDLFATIGGQVQASGFNPPLFELQAERAHGITVTTRPLPHTNL